MKKRFLAFVVIVISMAFTFPNEVDLPKSAIKKVEKTFTKLWPEQTTNMEEVAITETTKAKLPNNLNSDKYYKVYANGKLKGYLFLEKARSKFDKFDYMVIFKPDFSILTTQVLVYREDYGGEITSKRWLAQFRNKKDGRDMEFGHDIKNISGATISARSISVGIKKLSQNITYMRLLKAI